MILLALLGAPVDFSERLDAARRLEARGALEQARRIYEKLIPQIRASGDRSSLSKALGELAALSASLGDYDAAVRAGEEAAGLCGELGERRCEARAWNDAGLAFLYRGDYERALEDFQKSLELYRSLGDRQQEIYRLNNIGNAYYYQGRYLDALRAYQDAAERVRASSREPWTASLRQFTTMNLASLFLRLGRDEAALDLYQSLRSSSRERAPAEQGYLLANLGVLYRRLGDPIKALETYRAAEDLFARARVPEGRIGVLKNMGIALALDLEDYPAALKKFTQTLAMARRLSSRREAMQAELYRAEVFYRMRQYGPARQDWESALAAARALGTGEEQWKALYGLGRIAAARGDNRTARAQFEQAIGIIESVRSRLQLSSLKGEFLADKREVYDALIELLLKTRQDSADGLLEVMERARARSLQEQIDKPGARPELKEMRSRITRAYARRMRASGAAAEHADLELAELENQFLGLERKLEQDSGGETATARQLHARDLQGHLDGATALLMYWMAADGAAVLWLTHDHMGIAARQVSEHDVDAFLEALSRPSGRSRSELAERLGTELLGSLEPLADPAIRHLIIVPDGALALVPFEALEQRGEMLVERRDVAYLPAVSLLLRPLPARRRALPWKREALLIGDPVPQSGPAGVLIPGDERWMRLPRSAEEARAVARLLPGRVEVRLGAAAQKHEFLALDRQAMPLVHLATHAAVDDEDPARSRILFSAEKPGQGMDYLFLNEIYPLNLRGVDLATLSACETQRGKRIRGEGVQSFGRALLAAGARSTVTSLWMVADHPTAEFMKQFYYFLARGEPKAAALRLAKLKFLRSGTELADPYYWAAFVINGEGLAPIPPVVRWSTLAYGALLLLMAVFLAARLRTKARAAGR